MREKPPLIDTNVIVRYLVEDPAHVPEKFQGVFPFFQKVETGEVAVELPELVLFEVFYVLTRLYRVPQKEAARKLAGLVTFQGVLMRDKPLIRSCLGVLHSKPLGLVDAYLLAASRKKGLRSIYSYDGDLSKKGLELLEIK